MSKDRREAWPLETALRVRDLIGERHGIAVAPGLGCGLRQGEVFGVGPEDIDWARGVLHVRKQVQALGGKYALPKGGKTAVWTCPPQWLPELGQHIERFPPVEVELPWRGPGEDAARKKFPLLLTSRYGDVVAVNAWNSYGWKPALAKAGVIPPQAEGAKPRQWAAAPKDVCRSTVRRAYSLGKC
ncbi:hypothetical protein [Streptomyces sp. NBRC 110028]|uniref:hypothetical protein n=1 Tax=Streptomyces sp. NBRC 110028 TaxID=1621260 RepID=UPI0006E19C6C|nr:hypothetical protein [Streptomyces sp. NBRC 110028]